MKTYICIYNTGHDYGEFEFNSVHRKNSKGNLQDAKDIMWRRYHRKWPIIQIQKID